MRVTRISQRGVDLIKKFEGFRSAPYLDAAGIPTIGYGTIRYPNGRRVAMKDKPVTEAKAEEFLRHDVSRFELAVDAYTRDDINQNQFDALVSFTYNLGEGAYRSSTLARKVNRNPADRSIRGEFLKWVYAGGRKLKGLEARRVKEADLYFH